MAGEGIIVKGPEFVLPMPTQGQTTFSLTMPVIFSGSFGVCPLDVEVLGGCKGPSIATFTAHGTGLAFLQFELIIAPDQIPGSVGTWALSNATYIMSPVSPVPEPTSMTLFGTGAMALVGKFLRRRKLRTAALD